MGRTKYTGIQIADASLADNHIAAGAGILSSKLADGGNFVKKDGSVVYTGDHDFGNFRAKQMATPSTGTDGANKNYVDTAIANLNSIFDTKGSVRAATTGNVTVSNPGTAVFDGVTLSNGDRLLLKNQTAPAENGIYIFNGSGSALTRATDFDAWTEIPGGFVAVEEGSTNADTVWLCTSNQGGTLGTTAIAFQQIPTSAGLTNANFVDKETPSGSINGSNTAFTLANTPVAGSEHGYYNGQLLESGAGNDYTISGSAVTMLFAPETGSKLKFSYRK